MSPLKLIPFPKESTNSLLSWISNAEELQFWSGNTFKNGLNEEIFLRHLRRNDLYSFSFLGDNSSLVAYGEVVQSKKIKQFYVALLLIQEKEEKGLAKNLLQM